MAWMRRRRDKSATRAAVPASPTAEEHARQYAAELLTQAREELNRVDTKASILLATVGVTLGAVVGGLATRGWSPFRLQLATAVVWWAGVAAVSVGIMSLLAAVYPRHRQQVTPSAGGPHGYVGYYADVATYSSTAEVTKAIRRSARRDLDLMAEQLLQVSQIVDRKYRLLGWGVWLLVGGVASTAAALLLNAA